MTFKSGEMIVRDDIRHPEGTLVVDQHDQDGNLRAYPLGGGSELTIPAVDVARFSFVTKDEATPIFREPRFRLEGLDEIEFEGWTADKRWNCWVIPCFDIQRATVLRVVTAVSIRAAREGGDSPRHMVAIIKARFNPRRT